MINIARLWVLMVDRYAEFTTENLAFTASMIEPSGYDSNVLSLSHFRNEKGQRLNASLYMSGSPNQEKLRTGFYQF